MASCTRCAEQCELRYDEQLHDPSVHHGCRLEHEFVGSLQFGDVILAGLRHIGHVPCGPEFGRRGELDDLDLEPYWYELAAYAA